MSRFSCTAPTVNSVVVPSANVTGTFVPRFQPSSSAIRSDTASSCEPSVLHGTARDVEVDDTRKLRRLRW